MDLVVFSIAYPVTSLGPGQRVVLWVAGCGRRCEGCISPEMQDPGAGTPIPVHKVLRRLLRLDPSLDGLTVSGGEAFDQAEALLELLSQLRVERPAWSVMVYTGNVIEDIQIDARVRLLDFIDILIDGAYQQDIPQNHPLAGSGNQRIHYLTARARELQPGIDALPSQQLNLGLGTRNMLIGVAEASRRGAVCDAVKGSEGAFDNEKHDQGLEECSDM